MIKARKDYGVKKGSLPNIIMATIITIIMLVPTVPNLLFGAVRLVAYGEPGSLIFLLPVTIAVTVICTVWLLVRRFPREVQGFAMLFGLLLVLTVFYITSGASSCSGTQLCFDFGPLIAEGVFMLAIFLLSLYYLARVRRIERDGTKRTTK